ncbi:hypothetical protein K0U00_40920, partial [Paenibacillus sepulcri]|nr:hypothetical protein [Paenibacillus sepulcri]
MIKRGWNMGNRWWKQRTGRGRFYQKSLILVLCITSLPTAVIGIASYVLGVTNIERAVASAHQVLLGRT